MSQTSTNHSNEAGTRLFSSVGTTAQRQRPVLEQTIEHELTTSRGSEHAEGATDGPAGQLVPNRRAGGRVRSRHGGLDDQHLAEGGAWPDRGCGLVLVRSGRVVVQAAMVTPGRWPVARSASLTVATAAAHPADEQRIGIPEWTGPSATDLATPADFRRQDRRFRSTHWTLDTTSSAKRRRPGPFRSGPSWW